MQNGRGEFFSKKFDQADERRDFKAHGHLDILDFKEVSIGRAIFEPGWRWSNDLKPLVETESCQAAHTGYCLKGSMTIRMDDGKEFQIGAGEAFRIPAGHDAWVNGNETCELLDFTGYGDYAKAKKSEAA